jgi:predicted amidohydrolase
MRIQAVNFYTTKDYEENLERLINAIKTSSADFLLFPEVCLTGFDYENWDEVNKFGKLAVSKLSKLKKSFALTLIYDNKNNFCFFDEGLKYARPKYNLFGKEKKYFSIGRKPEIFEWKGRKIASLICFELRFIEYWNDFKGVDLILVPARWGKERKEHFICLNKALSLSLQTSVVSCNSSNEFSWGCVLDGWGEGVEFGNEYCITDVDTEKNFYYRKKINIGNL